MRSDLVVVGAGAAGLFAALTAAREGARVTLVSARPLAETASYWAQGGAAAALAVDDSPAIHLEDTLEAGRGLTKRSAAVTLTDEAAARVRELIELGCQFDADRHGDLALGLEGGHSRRRIIHAGGSATGRRILRALSAAAAAHPRITILEGERVSGLLEGGGVVLRRRRRHPGQGDAPRDRRRRGALVAHDEPAGLVRLRPHPRPRGRRPTRGPRVHAVPPHRGRRPPRPRGLPDLRSRPRRGRHASRSARRALRRRAQAPRPRVPRDLQPARPDAQLDMTAVDPERFPNIVEALQQAGLDPTTQRIPVAPASHYVMGGIVTDLDGRALPRLYAVGECACTGLHGANRLASNSLSECFVFGRRAALAALDDAPPTDGPTIDADVQPPTRETREAVWLLAGLERSEENLTRCSRTRTRSPVWSPPAPCIATRRAAPTAAPSSRTPTPPWTRTTRSWTRTPRRRASRHGRTPDRLGRRPHDQRVRRLHRLQRREGLAAEAVLDVFRHEPHLVDLECGTIDLPEFERRVAATLAVAPDGLAKRLMADVAPDVEMRRAVKRYHDAGIKTALVSNSWNEDDYDVDLHAMFDVVVLSQTLKIRKPAPEIFEVALERLQLPAAACVFVDDLGGNLKAAKHSV